MSNSSIPVLPLECQIILKQPPREIHNSQLKRDKQVQNPPREKAVPLERHPSRERYPDTDKRRTDAFTKELGRRIEVGEALELWLGAELLLVWDT